MVKNKIIDTVLRYCSILYYTIWQFDKYTNTLLINLTYIILKKIGFKNFAEKGIKRANKYNDVDGGAIFFSTILYDAICATLFIGLYFILTAFTGISELITQYIRFPVFIALGVGYLFAFITIRDKIRDKYFKEFENEGKTARYKYYLISIIMIIVIALLFALGVYLRFFRKQN